MLLEFVFLGVTDALLTSLTIILLFAYAGTHFYVRVLFDYHRDRMSRDFTVITVRLTFPECCGTCFSVHLSFGSVLS